MSKQQSCSRLNTSVAARWERHKKLTQLHRQARLEHRQATRAQEVCPILEALENFFDSELCKYRQKFSNKE